jgi:hypothetical protein
VVDEHVVHRPDRDAPRTAGPPEHMKMVRRCVESDVAAARDLVVERPDERVGPPVVRRSLRRPICSHDGHDGDRSDDEPREDDRIRELEAEPATMFRSDL